MRPIDLRSDTVTKPSPEMRRAMAEAEVGDDVFGEDPTVNALQEYAAALFGKEAGLFFPSGTMSNQAALTAHTRRGDEIFLHERAHILLYEQAGAAVHSQLQTRCFASPDGMLDPDAMEPYVHTDEDPHHAPTRLVALENTHNHCGGRVLDQRRVLSVRRFCDRHGLTLHLDGARVFNAVVASGLAPAEIAAPFDSVSVCLSKGLGAPVGSVLVGEREFVRRAIRARKVMGGAMRQAGIVAAAGLHALRHNVDRLADDHRHCRVLAERIAGARGLSVDLDTVETNMVFADTRPSGRPAAEVVRLLASRGVLCLDEGPHTVRFVTHLDLDDGDVERAAEIVVSVMTARA
ncbi:MAG TPA: low-specificity L-threonine aldolase [Thermoanaerobaculaceae bacterium]|nr:low-specificity L-threonine aldolase [Thermoanaerobaculaceae bacterium]